MSDEYSGSFRDIIVDSEKRSETELFQVVRATFEPSSLIESAALPSVSVVRRSQFPIQPRNSKLPPKYFFDCIFALESNIRLSNFRVLSVVQRNKLPNHCGEVSLCLRDRKIPLAGSPGCGAGGSGRCGGFAPSGARFVFRAKRAKLLVKRPRLGARGGGRLLNGVPCR